MWGSLIGKILKYLTSVKGKAEDIHEGKKKTDWNSASSKIFLQK